MADKIIEDFECGFCGEEIDGNFKFQVEVEYVNDPKESIISCPDCIATFFTETPEDIKTMTVEAI